jgi:hypothetical protein
MPPASGNPEEVPMDHADKLVARASHQTGLRDFGGDTFREGLGILSAALADEAGLNELGRAAMDAQIVDLLVNRLKVELWFARHPEIEDQEIAAPLIGLGLPRTGSTALACLLGCDPAVRSLRNWEAVAPCPPPETATAESDPRIAAMETAMERRASLFPRMTAMLPSTATSPTECQLFMAYDFKSQIFQAFAHVPSYVAWLNHTADMVPCYAYVMRVLKLLQWRCPPTRWRLKNPSHLLFIGALDQVFPDARFVMTHRDVAQVIPSVADLYFELHKAYSDTVDLPAIGADTAEFCELGLRRLIAFREAGNEHRFFDIQFAPFQRDPFPVIADLYAFLGEPLSDAALAGMQHWRETTPRNEGYDRTAMAEFDFSSETLHERFGFYANRFAVPVAA